MDQILNLTRLPIPPHLSLKIWMTGLEPVPRHTRSDFESDASTYSATSFGRGRIRTCENLSLTDLQSVAFNHSATLPFEGAGTRTLNTWLKRPLLYLLSYTPKGNGIGVEGFEPSLTDPKTVALPLGYTPIP